MGGFSFENVPDYQRKLDILANKTPFRPGTFLKANDEKLLKEVFDGQVEISEVELKRWAERHPEDSNGELRCRIVDANPLTVKILEFDADNEQQVVHEKWMKKQEKRKYWEKHVRKERRAQL